MRRRRAGPGHNGGTNQYVEDDVGIFRGALKTGIAMKALDIARREAAKPENQRKAKELFAKLKNRKAQQQPRRYR